MIRIQRGTQAVFGNCYSTLTHSSAIGNEIVVALVM
jgi:hypothetical protein